MKENNKRFATQQDIIRQLETILRITKNTLNKVKAMDFASSSAFPNKSQHRQLMKHNPDGTVSFRDAYDGNFICHHDLTNVQSSMVFDFDTLIAEYERDGEYVHLEVFGEVSVIYKGEHYDTPSKFPKELREIFALGKDLDENDVEVINNNWFEVFVSKTSDSSIVDYEGTSPEDLYMLLLDIFENADARALE